MLLLSLPLLLSVAAEDLGFATAASVSTCAGAAWASGSSTASSSAGFTGVRRPVDGPEHSHGVDVGGTTVPMISAITLQARGALGVSSVASLALPDQDILAFLGSGVGPSLDEGCGLGISPAKQLAVSATTINFFCCLH